MPKHLKKTIKLINELNAITYNINEFLNEIF